MARYTPCNVGILESKSIAKAENVMWVLTLVVEVNF